MKPKDDTKLWYVLLLCCAVLCFPMGLLVGESKRQAPEPEIIRSIGETQQQLRDAGYDIKVDYIWGPETERAYCDYLAKPYFTPSGRPKEK